MAHKDIVGLPKPKLEDSEPPTVTLATFTVALGSRDRGQWITIDGAPIVSSQSFLGQSGALWRVSHLLVNGKDLEMECSVMTSARRFAGRHKEASYRDELGALTDLPQPVPGSDNLPPFISAPKLCDGIEASLDDRSSIRHRLLLNTVGRPLWDYQSDVHFFRGMKAALLAHKCINEAKYLLRRDISPGCIALSNDETAHTSGFLVDLDLAATASCESVDIDSRQAFTSNGNLQIQNPILKEYERMSSAHELPSPFRATPNFMACDALRSMKNPSFVARVTHDIESFFWVIPYCVLSRSIRLVRELKVKTDENSLQWTRLDKEERNLEAYYGRLTEEKLISQRERDGGYSALLMYLREYIWRGTVALWSFVRKVSTVLAQRHSESVRIAASEPRMLKQDSALSEWVNPEALRLDFTYASLLTPLDAAIHALEQTTN